MYKHLGASSLSMNMRIYLGSFLVGRYYKKLRFVNLKYIGGIFYEGAEVSTYLRYLLV